MKTCNEKFIGEYVKYLLEDEYDDELQKESRGINIYIPDEVVGFIKRNIKPGRVLEIGCGSGQSFSLFGITDAVEPSEYRRMKAVKRARELGLNIRIAGGFVESLPYDDETFDTVLMIDGWNQIRSDYEALYEVNRVLKKGGVFIFDLWDQYNPPLYYGRVYAMPHYIYWVKQFGFEILERRNYRFKASWIGGVVMSRWLLSFEKISEVNLESIIKKLQLIPVKGVEGKTFKARNWVTSRDGWLT